MAIQPLHAGHRSVATTCPYCGVGCGVVATTEEDGRVTVDGDPTHPANHGHLCSKGAALAETLEMEDRLLYPEIVGRRVTWDEALDATAEGFLRVVRNHGPEAVAFYCSGQLLTEDYYVANKLMKGFIGTANIDTNSRLCMASTVVGHKRAFGADTVPGCYDDLDAAELIVLVGSNAAWCHPVLYQRLSEMQTGSEPRKVVVIDPRRTATCDLADLHLALRPGSDAILFNGLLAHLHTHGFLDEVYIECHTEGFAEALAAARASAPDVATVADRCGLPEVAVAQFYHWFATTERAVTLFSQGINQSSSGSDKVNTIINCHLATGRVGRPGMGPFSLTGQPNAMGGREVGGLATTLAAHMDFGDAACDRVQGFWGSPTIARAPGLKAVEMFQAIADGRIKAVWIMATNPAVSLPAADQVNRALARCDLVAVSDCVRRTDTTTHAHILLPATTWGEKAGTVTNSERRISRQRPFLAAPGEARPDWWIITQVARRMGFADGFPYASAGEIFREHATLSGLDNRGERAFDIGGLAHLDDAAYDALEPIQWPVPDPAHRGTARMYTSGGFHTPSGRARFIAVEPRRPAMAPSRPYPFLLNTGRIRDQWHTMTRTGTVPRLTAHIAEPQVEIHPDEAAELGLQDGALARLTSTSGTMLARVRPVESQLPDTVFVPIHWSDRFAAQGRANALVPPVTDPLSGEPEFKHTPIAVAPFQPVWHGFAFSRAALEWHDVDYCVRIRGRQFWRYELAGEQEAEDWTTWSREYLPGPGEWLEYRDHGARRYRAARLHKGRLQACLFVGPTHDLPTRTWLAQLFAETDLDGVARTSLLTARPPIDQPDAGPTLCSCFGIGRNALVEAIRRDHLTTPEAVGAALRAGTNCGSCVPELRTLIHETLRPPAAALATQG